MSIFSHLKNSQVWYNFEAINAIPRASKKEEQIIAFMMDFGQKLGLETIKDEVGNVIIKKPATKGKENAPTIILQSHLDMVHQKNNDTQFDFETEGIKMYIDGDWVKASGTTLGADNGLGVATIMTILASNDIPHPAIEALFTIDEETGMTGAKGLKAGLLNGSILLNLDTEDDNEITIGCAGGIDLQAMASYTPKVATAKQAYRIGIKGLNGGHSGMEIHKGLGNANKLMNRVLYVLQQNHTIELASINGGGLRNAIPRESVAIIVCDEAIQHTFEAIKKDMIAEYKAIEPNITIDLEAISEKDLKVLPAITFKKLTQAIYAAHNGVYRMSPNFGNLVETSNNIARVLVQDGNIAVLCLSRSSVESSKKDVVNSLTAAFELMDAEVTTSGEYPGWTPNANSKILQQLRNNYELLFGHQAHVTACHAGLECGILGINYPALDMISFGPTILGAHSPDEKASISSFDKFYQLLLQTLASI